MSEHQHRFHKILRAREVVTLAFGAMVGWGWVLMSGVWIQHAGSIGTLIAFLCGGIAIGFIAITYAELASALPKAGGEHVYTHRALGPAASFVCTWALLMAYATVCLFESVALPTAIEYLVPSIRMGSLWHIFGSEVDIGFVLIGVGSAILMTVINIFGIRFAAMIQTIVTALIFLAGTTLIVGAAANTENLLLNPPVAIPISGILVVLIMVPGMLVGFDVIPQSAEEIDLPARKIGILLIASLVLAVLWYAGISFAVSITIPPAELATSTIATADAASRAWNHPSAGVLLVIGGIGGILTSWNAFIIGGSRVLFALSESGFLPSAFGKLHPKYKTPWVGVVALGMAACISPFFGKTVLTWLINTGSFAVVLAFLFVPVAFLVLRKKEPSLNRPFSVPWPRAVGITAIILGITLFSLYLPFSPSALIWPYEWGLVILWALLGAIVFLNYRKTKKQRTQELA